MKLLVDTDVFCKLGKAGLLMEAIGLFGAEPHECGRLPALPHMLRRGALREHYGGESCDALVPLANDLPVLPAADPHWLELLRPVKGVDPGEAQLFGAAVQFDLLLLSGDVRAMRSVKAVNQIVKELNGRIVCLEAILLTLCEQKGPEYVRGCVDPLRSIDKMIRACFSPGNADPVEGLVSYKRTLDEDVNPLVLWSYQPSTT